MATKALGLMWRSDRRLRRAASPPVPNPVYNPMVRRTIEPMKNYLVISYLPDTNQIVFDTVLAETEDRAEAEVRRVRGADIEVGEVHDTVEFTRTVASWATETPLQTWESWKLTAECYDAAPQPKPELNAQ
jgi:hypothetical protein